MILWHERLTAGSDGEANAQALLELARSLSLHETEGAGLLEIPAGTNGRGLREAGVLPNAAAGLGEVAQDGRDARGIAESLAAGELAAALLMQSDPLIPPQQSAADERPSSNGRTPAGEDADVALWERALGRAATVVAFATVVSDGLREHANVVFPAQAYAEKEGTIVHPDGRIQRLRPAVANPGETRAQWRVLVELARYAGVDLDVSTGPMASQQLFDAVPFYGGLTLEEIGGKGVRWQERSAAQAYPPTEQLV